jgi:glycosyltransferase involved in cell wall biosynthesis
MSANPELSVVIPTLDEEGSVGEAISDLHRVCRGLGIRYEVLVVDGGSRDRTVELAERAGAQVFRQQRPGYGGALLDAFERARGAWVATMDSDLSHPPTVLRSL